MLVTMVPAYGPLQERKQQINVRLTPTARALLARIASTLGITHGNVIEMLIRAEASRLGLAAGFATEPHQVRRGPNSPPVGRSDDGE